MERPLDRLAAALRTRPFAVDAALAAGIFLFTVALRAGSYGQEGTATFLVGLFLTAPLA